MNRQIAWIKAHKKVSLAIGAIAAIAIGYFAYAFFSGSGKVTKYVLAAAAKETVISTVSGSGQVSASNQVAIAAKASGAVIAVKAKAGDSVKKGQLLVQLDATDAAKAVRDAEISLKSAQLSLEKAERGTRAEEMVSTELSLADATAALARAQKQADTDLEEKYDDTKSIIQDAYSKSDDAVNRQLQGLYSDNSAYAALNVISLDSQSSSDCGSLRVDAISALSKLKAVLSNYPEDQDGIDSALAKSIDYMSTMQKYLLRLNDLLSDAVPSGSITQSSINSFKSSALSVSTSIAGALSALKDQKQAIASQRTANSNNISTAESSLAKAQNSLDLAKAGADPLDLAAQRLSVQQKANALADARSQYSDYAITAPFDGQVASISVEVGYYISIGGEIATVITPNKVAEIAFGESDIAKIKTGQKASLVFDAIEDLEMTGSVAKADLIGAVSSGVVSYAVTISLDANDDRIKPGMSVTASIITDTKVDALTVPNSAVKSKNGQNYVLTLPSADAAQVGNLQGVESDAAPIQTTVSVGISDDSNTEILSGLSEGEIVVTKTTTVAKSSQSAAPSLLQSLTPGRSKSGSTNKSSSSSSGATKSSSGSSGAASSGSSGGDMVPPPGM